MAWRQVPWTTTVDKDLWSPHCVNQNTYIFILEFNQNTFIFILTFVPWDEIAEKAVLVMIITWNQAGAKLSPKSNGCKILCIKVHSHWRVRVRTAGPALRTRT